MPRFFMGVTYLVEPLTSIPNSPAHNVAAVWQTSRFQIELSRPRVMGIVNATPDSFSDGGAYFSSDHPQRALSHCERLLSEGADMLDIGAESTRPGAEALPLNEELARLLPVLRHALTLGVPVSVDTYKPQVMQVALDLGADIINDIWALRQAGAADVVATHPYCGICLMHMHREPLTMQAVPMEGEVFNPVREFLAARATDLRDLGILPNRIVLDPGIGFGKTVAQNFELLRRQADFLALGHGLLAGWSRKSSLGAVCDPTGPARDRMLPSVTAALLAVERGARVVRVHDVHETVTALKVWVAAS